METVIMKETGVDVVCRVQDVSKLYPGVVALDAVSMDIRRGEIHGIIGKNGAGKSTLVNILAGFTPLSTGEITIDGRQIPRNYNPRVAEQFSVFLVPQNPLILPGRNIAENLFAGYIPKKKSGLVDHSAMYEKSREIIDLFGLNLNPDQEMGTLPVDTQKLLLFGKAVYVADADLFMLDEITASLNISERQILDRVLKELVRKGKSILFISHHLKEIQQYCDRVTVLRNGHWIQTLPVGDTTEEELANLIVGRDVEEYTGEERPTPKNIENPVLSVRNLKVFDYSPPLEFTLSFREVLGFAGLEGCGKNELFDTVSGSRRDPSCELVLNGRQECFRSPREAIGKGIASLPRDRETESVFHGMSILDNMMRLLFRKLTSKIGLLNERSIHKRASDYVEYLNIKIAELSDDIDSLSGGNKQKVIVARVMSIGPKVTILNEPTQGIDVEAKQEVLRVIREEMAAEASVIVSSESVQELMAVCDRIAVMYRGEIVKVFDRDEFSEDEIYLSMQGSKVERRR